MRTREESEERIRTRKFLLVVSIIVSLLQLLNLNSAQLIETYLVNDISTAPTNYNCIPFHNSTANANNSTGSGVCFEQKTDGFTVSAVICATLAPLFIALSDYQELQDRDGNQVAPETVKQAF